MFLKKYLREICLVVIRTRLHLKPLAEAGKLVTFGIVPTEPHTGYGYIEAGSPLADAYEVTSFKEKPDASTAAAYLRDSRYYWNSVMFLFKACQYLHELKTFRPDIFAACELAISNICTDLDFIRIDTLKFRDCPSDSIDYAVMEKLQTQLSFQ